MRMRLRAARHRSALALAIWAQARRGSDLLIEEERPSLPKPPVSSGVSLTWVPWSIFLATLRGWHNKVAAFREALHWHGSSKTGSVKPAVAATLSTRR